MGGEPPWMVGESSVYGTVVVDLPFIMRAGGLHSTEWDPEADLDSE